jgi:hypothetical protein
MYPTPPYLNKGNQMNRIVNAIEEQKKNISDRLTKGIITQKQVDSLNASLNMESDEFHYFQEVKSLAVMKQSISLDEGNTIYRHLGATPETFNNQPVEVKVVLTQIFAELMKAA